MQRSDRGCNARTVNELNVERRWSKRQSVYVPIALVSAEGGTVSAKILNMADSGLMIELAHDDNIHLYSVYTIDVPSYFHSECFAIWQEDNRAGMLLSLPVHPAVISGLGRKFPRSNANVAHKLHSS